MKNKKCRQIIKPGCLAMAFFLLLVSCKTPDSTTLDDFLISQMDATQIPGLAYGIMQDGKLTKTGYLGTADFEKGMAVSSETLFMLASCSKTVTATAVMMLYEQGKINLDDPIDRYLPFPVKNPHFPENEISIRQLLTHTSSLMDNWDVLDPLYTCYSGEGGDSPISLEQFLSSYLLENGTYYNSENNFNNKKSPGEKRIYCNVGFAVLGYLVECVTGIGFDEFCGNNIFLPLNMNKTSWFLKDTDESVLAMPYWVEKNEYLPVGHYGYPSYPDGQIRTSIEEWSRFVSIFLNKGEYEGNTLLRSETMNEFLSIQYPDVDKYQAVCWNYNEFSPFLVKNFLGELPAHTGGDEGVATITVIDPDNGNAILIFMNGIGDKISSAYTVYWRILKVLAKEAGMHK